MIISALSVTDERKKEIAFAGPYLESGQAVIVKTGSSIKTIADLKGKIIGAQLGSTGETAADKVPGVGQVKTYDKVPEELQDLLIGRIDAVVVDKPVGGYYIASDKNDYRILDQMLTDEPMGIGLRLTDTELTSQVQQIYEGLVSDGTMSKLSEKWFGYNAYAK